MQCGIDMSHLLYKPQIVKHVGNEYLCLLTDVNFISVTPDYPDQALFSWSHYLEETGSKAVAADAFKVVRAINKCYIHSQYCKECLHAGL